MARKYTFVIVYQAIKIWKNNFKYLPDNGIMH